MIRYLCCLLLVITAASDSQPVWATVASDTSGVPSLRANFAIPDAPAFLMLDLEPSNLLRPQSPRDLSLTLAKFQGEDGIVLPRALAAELSPLLLISGDSLTVAGYQARRAWYATRLSLAVLRDSSTGETTRLGAGIRISLTDQRAFKTDQAFPKDLRVTELLGRIRNIHMTVSDRAWIKSRAQLTRDSTENNWTEAQFDEALMKARESLVVSYSDEETEELGDLKALVRKRFADRYWNADVLDLAAGVRVESPDSTGQRLRFAAYRLWASWAKGLGGWGQFVLGGRWGGVRDTVSDSFLGEGGAGTRLYLGSGDRKFYLEEWISGKEKERAKATVATGLEFTLNNWLWLNLGVERSATKERRPETRSIFKFKSGLP